MERALDGLASFVIARPRRVLVATGLASLILLAFVPRIELNDDFVAYFDHRVDFRNDADFAAENLNGIYVIEYSLESGEPGGISEPAYLDSLERFTGWLREQPEVTHVFTAELTYAVQFPSRISRSVTPTMPSWSMSAQQLPAHGPN